MLRLPRIPGILVRGIMLRLAAASAGISSCVQTQQQMAQTAAIIVSGKEFECTSIGALS